MISHRNVISNILQIALFEKSTRDARPENERTEVALGLLPLSHIYGLVVIAQASTYRGDEVIILPKFELHSYLNAIQTYKIWTLYLVSGLVLSGRCLKGFKHILIVQTFRTIWTHQYTSDYLLVYRQLISYLFRYFDGPGHISSKYSDLTKSVCTGA